MSSETKENNTSKKLLQEHLCKKIQKTLDFEQERKNNFQKEKEKQERELDKYIESLKSELENAKQGLHPSIISLSQADADETIKRIKNANNQLLQGRDTIDHVRYVDRTYQQMYGTVLFAISVLSYPIAVAFATKHELAVRPIDFENKFFKRGDPISLTFYPHKAKFIE